jgi:predicted ABC-type ATPase
MPTILIIAGPNGAGKTTIARKFLTTEAEYRSFINADLIAAGLAPFSPEEATIQAGRIMLSEIGRHVEEGKSFAFETTLSGRGYARMIPRWRQSGYVVTLVFVRLRSVEMSVQRVADRVRRGGHNIPEDVIRRRFPLGLANLESLYKPLVDGWMLYDNSGDSPILVDQGTGAHGR